VKALCSASGEVGWPVIRLVASPSPPGWFSDAWFQRDSCVVQAAAAASATVSASSREGARL